ncbi:MAG: hypothetical protein WD077_07390 [Bacteroidia bacterium]
MKTLSENWFFEGRVDFEYKKYILLAYLQEVDRNFSLTKLYPHLALLVQQYANLNKFLEEKRELQDQFPTDLEKFDSKQFRLIYKKVINDDDLMDELEAIVDFSRGKIKSCLEEGKEIYEFIEKHIAFSTVGLVPLDLEYGLLLFRWGKDSTMRVYRYKVGLFESFGENYRTIATQFLRAYESTSYAPGLKVKESVIKEFALEQPPATYLFESEFELPMEETYLPIAKRMLARHITIAA